MNPKKKSWWTVRSIFRTENQDGKKKWSYEERLSLWEARSRSSAIERALRDAEAYADDIDGRYRGPVHVARVLDDIQDDGCEIFSFGRTDKRNIVDYVDRFYRTHSKEGWDTDSKEYRKHLKKYKKDPDLELLEDLDWQWWSVRSVYRSEKRQAGIFSYIERVTLWNTSSGDAALDLAMAEAKEFSGKTRVIDSGFYSACGLEDDPRTDGAEVFSHVRVDNRTFKKYMNHYVSTGREFTPPHS
jgi:hypothetical protein